jgi:myo-inositol-1-phosphate synthase
MANKINIAIVGVGNCASALLQGLAYYQEPAHQQQPVGLMNLDLGGYTPVDIQVVAAFDIDQRKVGQDVAIAIFAPPNCTTQFYPEIEPTGVPVTMGCILDGFSDHLKDYPEERRFVPSDQPQASKQEIIEILKKTKTDILINYLPVGSEKATQFYAECALEARVGFINCIPVFIASDPVWANKFSDANLPIIGDDIKSQLGATITHRVLSDLFKQRGVQIERTYQLNTGGNTDFLNMLNHDRLATKKISKTEAVQSALTERLDAENIHVGPSDYVPWQKDNKVCFIRIEGKLFGDVPMNLELRLSVEDSPNSAGVVIDAIRCCKLALDRKIGGPLWSPSAYFMKHPPKQLTEDDANTMTRKFIAGSVER